jgi:hypothetical protein
VCAGFASEGFKARALNPACLLGCTSLAGLGAGAADAATARQG